MNILEQGYNALFPSAEELWEKTGAQMVPVEAADGSIVDRPFYDLEVTNKDTYKKPLDVEELVTRRGRHLGFAATHQVEVNGMDHLCRAIVTGGSDLTITSGTAYMTTINGYPKDRAIKMAADTGQSHLQVGPPHSGKMLPFFLEGLRVPETLDEARATSLARTAQIQQCIFEALSGLYELPPQQYPVGDSLDAITTPGQYLYAPMYGAKLVGFNNAARCMIYRMELKDVLKLPPWIAKSVVGGVAVGVCLAKEGQLGTTVKGATSANPNFWTSMLTGTTRSLTGGESRLLMDTVPRDAHGIDKTYGRDGLDTDKVKEAWGEHHPNVYVKPIPRGTHPALLHPIAHKGTRSDVARVVKEHNAKNGNVDAMDWDYIHGLKDSEATTASAA